MSNSQYPQVSPAMSTAESTTVDLLIVPVFGSEDRESEIVKGLDASSNGVIARAWNSGEFSSKRHQVLQIELQGADWGAKRAVLIGTETRDGSVLDRLRLGSAVGARVAKKLKVARFGILCRGNAANGDLVKAVIEGVGHGGFTDQRYRGSQEGVSQPTSCELVWPQTCPKNLTESIRHGKSIARSVSLAREFSNDPANILTPDVFAERAVALCEEPPNIRYFEPVDV